MKSTPSLRRLAAILAILLSIAGPVSAQGSKWWMSDTYKRELGLTIEQSRRLEDIFQAALPTLRSQKRALDDAEKQFQAVMEREVYSSVMEKVEHLENARAALNRTRTMMLVNMRKVLTSDQWIRFGAMQQAAEQRKADPAHKK